MARSVDGSDLRNWLIRGVDRGLRARGADRARYGEGLIDALAAAFKARGVDGLGRSNLKNYRQIALTWPRWGFARRCLANRSTVPIWQTVPAESIPALTTAGELLPLAGRRTDAAVGPGAVVLAPVGAGARATRWRGLLRGAGARPPVERARAQAPARLHAVRARRSVARDRRPCSPSPMRGGCSTRQPRTCAILMCSSSSGCRNDRHTQSRPRARWSITCKGSFWAWWRLRLLGRQYRITVGGRHHFIDLLFFHRRLRCLVAIDLKIGSFGLGDAGQMNFYLEFPARECLVGGRGEPARGHRPVRRQGCGRGALRNRQSGPSGLCVAVPDPTAHRTTASRWLAEERELLAHRPASKEVEL